MKHAMNLSPRNILFVLIATTFTLASCRPDDTNNLNGVGNIRIGRDTTWTSSKPILLEGTVNIEGATLTIEAGTTIRMGRNGAIVVGEKLQGTLQIQGTSEAPVRIIPQSQEIYWRGIHVLKTTTNSHISYCELEQASAPNNVALELSNINFRIDNLRINKCGGDGLEIHRATPNSSAKISNLYVTTSSGNPIVGDASLLYALGNNITLASPKGGVYLTSGTLTAPRLHFRKFACPYIVRTEVSIDAQQLSFDNGTRFEFERDGALNFGENSETRIQANNVTFTSRAAEKQPGSWRGITVNTAAVGQGSYFRKCEFNAGGGGTGKGNLVLIDVNGLEVSDCLFAHSAGYGIVLISSNIFETTSNRFEGNVLGERKDK